MKISIIGANGKSGKLLVEEALNRGHEVTAIVRNGQATTPNAKVLEKDLFNLTYDDVKDSEVIIDAFGTWTPKSLPLHQTSLKYLSGLLGGKPNRLLIVGSAGSLYVDPQHTMRLLDSPDMPEMYKPLSTNMVAAFDALKKRNDVNWTYLSPPAIFDADSVRTGKYRVGGDELMVNSKGESVISYADAAIAMIDEAEWGKHIRQRFTVVSE
ncbi:NAD(P)-dependent oxidoreductase [Clostridium sporogenes]